MIYIQLIINIFGFSSQLLKWMNKAEDRERSTKAKCEKLKKFKKALKSAEEGKTDEMEEMFSILRPKSK